VAADKTLRKAAIALNIGGAQSWAYLCATVDKYPVLLTPEGDAFLTEIIERLQPDDPSAIMRWYLRDLMRRCAQDGAEQVLTPAGQASTPLRLQWFLRFATSQPAVRVAVEKAPDLMREQSVAELERMIEFAAGIGDFRAVGWRHLPWLLRTCRAHGLDATLLKKAFDPAYGARHRRREIHALQRQAEKAAAAFHATGALDPMGSVIGRFLELIADPWFQREDSGVQAGIISLTAMLIGMRADEVGYADDLRIAASMSDRAARLADPGSLALAFVTRNRAGAMAELASRTSHLADTEAAVEAATVAVEVAQAQPWMAFHPRASLAMALHARFVAAGAVADLRAAADRAREALVMTPPWQPDWPRLAVALAPARVQYAQSFGDSGTWREIISELRAADRALHPQSPDRPQLQALLDTALAALAESL
jgi:hypothetical protein